MSAIVEHLVFPNTRDVLYELIDGAEFAGRTVTAYYQLPVDYSMQAQGSPVVLIYTAGGTQGWIDRVDRATVEVYAPGTAAVEVAEGIAAAVVGQGHDLAAGYVDEIVCDITPHDVPHASEAVNLARAGYLDTTRPI